MDFMLLFSWFHHKCIRRENLLYTMKNRGQPFIYHEYHRQGTSLTHGPLSLPALREVIESHRRTSVRGGEVFGEGKKNGVGVVVIFLYWQRDTTLFDLFTRRRCCTYLFSVFRRYKKSTYLLTIFP